MTASSPLDSLGRRRSPASVPGYLAGRPSRNKGRRYPPDPPRTEEIIAVMRCCGEGVHGARARGLIVVLWRAGLRIQEALDLSELDLDRRRGSVLVRRGKGGRRREVGMDDWGFEQLEPWLGRASGCRSVRCSASSTGAPAGAPGTPRPPAPRCVGAPPGLVYGVASRRISCAMRMRSSSRARACRSTSFNANSVTATSA